MKQSKVVNLTCAKNTLACQVSKLKVLAAVRQAVYVTNDYSNKQQLYKLS